MSQAIINLAIPVIRHTVEDVLDSYPASSCRQAFASTVMREKLMAYVLSRMPALYTTVEDSSVYSVEKPANCFSSEQKEQMNMLIRDGIQHLMAQQQPGELAGETSSVAAGLSPSSWFG